MRGTKILMGKQKYIRWKNWKRGGGVHSLHCGGSEILKEFKFFSSPNTFYVHSPSNCFPFLDGVFSFSFKNDQLIIHGMFFYTLIRLSFLFFVDN